MNRKIRSVEPSHANPSSPRRVQLSRAKGWRMPPNTVKVDRSTRWGNPFSIGLAMDLGVTDRAKGPAFVVECFRLWIGPMQRGRDLWQGPESEAARRPFVEEMGRLRGKNLACWCKLGSPCHADVLLELANAPLESGTLDGSSQQDSTDAPRPSDDGGEHGR